MIRHFIKTESKIIKNEEVHLQQKIQHSFSKYFPSYDMQWCHN